MKKLIVFLMALIIASNVIVGGSTTKQEAYLKQSIKFDMCQLQDGTQFLMRVNSGSIKLLTEKELLVQKLENEKNKEELRKKEAYNNMWKGVLGSWLKALGHRETRNDPSKYNKYGYIGEWQFGKAALEYTGYGHITYADFKNDPLVFGIEAQYDAMIKFTKANRRALRKYIRKYEGTEINGIVITESGILAGAHIGGAGGMQKYLDSGGNKNPSDKFNTSIEDYLKEFSGYKLKFT